MSSAKWRSAKRNAGEADGDLWLVSYADLISAILAVLVLVMSFSRIDIARYDQVQKVVFAPPQQEEKPPYATLQEIHDRVLAAAKKGGVENQVDLSLKSDGLEINLNAVVLFKSGSAELNYNLLHQFDPVFDVIANISADRYVDIVGHTDDVPYRVRNKDNWNLSADRAVEMQKYLATLAMNNQGTRVVAYGDTQPRVSPAGLSGTALDAARAKNRRVSLWIGTLKRLDLHKEPSRNRAPEIAGYISEY